tara:strand:+ start:1084 stop:2493 length:1410 start_codon:yes stop_codon:yes gene_type:complete
MDPTATNYESTATHPCNNDGPNNNPSPPGCADCFGNTDHCGPGTYPGDCCVYPATVNGCIDPLACNYDPLATIDDGTCTYPGCTDPAANNYDSIAGCSDGSCTYDVLGCTDSTANNYNPLANVDNGSCTYDILGCTDSFANNYNVSANIDDGSCIYDVLGCTDPNASNYDTTATIDDGSCDYLGCTDPTANNYNPAATIDDGSCEFTLGCTDSAANNYDPNAVVDDGSCTYDLLGCTDPNAINYDSSATIDDNSCIYPIYGCTDPLAFNYNSQANTDDGSCINDLTPCCEWCATGPIQPSIPPTGCADWMCDNNDYCPPVVTTDNPCDGLVKYLKQNYSNWIDPNQVGIGGISGVSPIDLDVVHFCEKCKYEGLNDPMCKCCKKDPCDKNVLFSKLQQTYNLELPEFCKYCKDGFIQDDSCKCCKKFEKIKDKKPRKRRKKVDYIPDSETPIDKGLMGEEIKRIKQLLK